MKERVTHEFRLTVTDLRKEIITFAAKLEVSFHTKNHVRYVKKKNYNQINLPNLHKSSLSGLLLSLWSAAAVLSVMCQVAHYLQQPCIIALHITVRLQQGYSNTKIYCKIFLLSQSYPECNANYSILL